jgi:hypothetical protein
MEPTRERELGGPRGGLGGPEKEFGNLERCHFLVFTPGRLLGKIPPPTNQGGMTPNLGCGWGTEGEVGAVPLRLSRISKER